MDELKKNGPLIIFCAMIIGFTLLLVAIFNMEADEDGHSFLLSDNAFLRNFGVNEAVPVHITEEQMARMYLAEFVHLIMNNPEQAYELLDEAYREAAFPTFESFQEYLVFMRDERFFRATLEKFEVRSERGYRIYDLIDIAGNNFIFQVTSIMNYTVLLDNHTIIH